MNNSTDQYQPKIQDYSEVNITDMNILNNSEKHQEQQHLLTSRDEDDRLKDQGDQENQGFQSDDYQFKLRCRRFLAFIGPGFLMCIAYLDPGNIAGDLEAGNAAGYKLMWALLVSTCLGLFYQILAARLGVVTQRNLAQLCREQFPPYIRIILWLMTEVAIIGCDIQEVIGSAIALQILFGIPIWAGAIITIVDSLLFLFIHYFGMRKLEVFFAFLISIMAVCFMINFFVVKPNAAEVLEGTFVPTIPAGTIEQFIGLIGAVIMPHNLYLHSSLVLSRKVNTKSKGALEEANMYNAFESAISLFISFIINFCVIGTFAYYHTNPDPEHPTLSLMTASSALQRSFGSGASYIWGVGLLAAGQSSTMTGTYAGQFVMEGFFDIKLAVWKRVIVTRFIAIVPAFVVAFINLSEYDVIDTYLNILQSFQLPFALLPLLRFTSSDLIMGPFKNKFWLAVFAYVMGTILFILNWVGIFPTESPWWVYFIIGIVAVGYVAMLYLVIRQPLFKLKPLTKEEQDQIDIDRVEVDAFTNKND